MKPLLRRVVESGVYQEKFFVNDEYVDAITATEVWTAIERVVVMMGPLCCTHGVATPARLASDLPKGLRPCRIRHRIQ